MLTLHWYVGNWSAYPKDGRAYIEGMKATAGGSVWKVYDTNQDGSLPAGYPRLTDQTFLSCREAQEWVEENVPRKEPTLF